MSINNTNPSVHFGGTWELISSVMLASNAVYGNGKALALMSSGSDKSSLFRSSNGYADFAKTGYGTNTGTTLSSFSGVPKDTSVGVPTKTQLGSNLDYSGLISDTITVYSFKRIA